VDDEQDQYAVLDGTVDNDVVANRKTPDIPTEIWTRAAHFRLSGVEAAFLVDAFQQPVRGVRAVSGNMEPDFNP
jgi:hypothetical protein